MDTSQLSLHMINLWASTRELRQELLRMATSGRNALTGRALDPIAGEFVGARFARALRIGAPGEVRLVSHAEMGSLPRGGWILKSWHGSRVRAWLHPEPPDPSARVLIAVKRIPGAISLYYLGKLHGIDGGPSPIRMPGNEGRVEAWGANHIAAARAFFSDFVPTDVGNIKRSVAWDSDPMLRIHAMRAFLGCTAAHAGNILVDARGNLYSIDHECVALTDGSELDFLFANIDPRTRAFGVLGDVANLAPTKIAELFDDLPAAVEWPIGDKDATVKYFHGRLMKWKELFERAKVSAHDSR